MNVESRPRILEHMAALSDGLRSRILLLLDRKELTVSELCAVLQLPQSTASRHLKTLVDAGWIVSRRDGTRRLYQMPRGNGDSPAGELWRLARRQLDGTPAAEEDSRRLASVLAERRTRSREFFDSADGQWDRLRDELFGNRFYLFGLAGLLDDGWVVGDLGCGTGPLSEALAPFVRSVISVDGSAAMVAAAQRRLDRFTNVDVRRGELEALPIEDDTLDAATLILVLHHLSDPGAVLREVARVLRPGGRLLIVDMLPHDRDEYMQEMGHVWMGFSDEQIAGYFAGAKFRAGPFHPLGAEPAAKGPTLFAATATLETDLHEPNDR